MLWAADTLVRQRWIQKDAGGAGRRRGPGTFLGTQSSSSVRTSVLVEFAALLLFSSVPMPLYAEHWSARPEWMALSIPDRIAFLDQLGPDMNRLRASSASLIGVVLRETKRLHRSDCYYMALWRMPEGGAHIEQLNALLEAVGWGRYFEPAAPVADVEVGAESDSEPRPPTREIRSHSALNGDLRAES